MKRLCIVVLAWTTGTVAVAQDAEAGAEPAPEVEADAPPQAPSEEQLEARRRFQQGVALARAGNCEGALAELRASLALVERANTLYNIARCHEELFRYDLAVGTYERYLAIAPSDAEDRPAVDATMRQLRNLLGTISIQTNVPADVWIGERIVGSAPGEVLVPGGRHSLELRAEGRVAERREVEVAGRQRVTVEVELREARVTNVTEQHTHQTTIESGGAPPAVFYSGVVATSAAALVGAAFGGLALASKSDTESESAFDREAIAAGNERTADRALLADIFFGVAGALAITTIVLYFLTDWDGETGSVENETGWRLSPVGVEARF